MTTPAPPLLLIVAVSTLSCGATHASGPDATGSDAASNLCGNGVVDVREACDGTSVDCASLGGSFSGGTASCRPSCSGWDVSRCVLAARGEVEIVKPAERDPSRWSDARCNDGTAFPFGVSLAPTPSRVWLIYLEGGVYCDDVSLACSQRMLDLTTSWAAADGSPAPGTLAGLFRRNPATNPDFAGANLVFAHYCSSDFWAGATTDRRRTTGDPTRGWYFSGHANVDAMLAILAERYGLDDADPTLRLLFSGGSAGAFGAHFNIARAAAAMPVTRAAGRLMMLVDAGWMTDWDDPTYRLGMATISDREVWRSGRTFWAATFDPACEAAHTDSVDCVFGPGWYPAVSSLVPTLIQQSSADIAFMGSHGIQPTDPIVDTWRAQVKASFAPVTWLFSGDASYHTLATTDAGLAKGPAGSTLVQVIDRFWANGPPERVTF